MFHTRRALSAFFAFGLVLASSPDSLLGAGLQDSPWPMFQRNSEHKARTEAPVSTSPSVLWSTPLAGLAEFASPAIDEDGNIYIGDLGDRLHKIAPDGSVLWSFDTGGNVRRSTPAIAEDGTIHIGASDGSLHAIHPDGTSRWSYTAGGGVKTAPAIGSDGSVYFGSDDGKLYALDENGALRWTYTTSDTVRSSPALATDSLIVFGSNDGSITALDTDGALRWSGATGGPVKAGVSVGQGDDIFVPSQDGFLYAIRTGGALIWTSFTGRTLRGTPAIGVTGRVYLPVDDEIWCIDDDGVVSWTASTGGEIFASPVVHTNADTQVETVIVGNEAGLLTGLQDGNIVWTVTLGSPIRSSVAIGADGTLYVGANDARLYALGETTSSTEVAEFTEPLLVLPNPARSGESVTFRSPALENGTALVFDPAGRRVSELPIEDGLAVWNQASSPAGVYFYRWTTPSETREGRLVVVR